MANDLFFMVIAGGIIALVSVIIGFSFHILFEDF